MSAAKEYSGKVKDCLHCGNPAVCLSFNYYQCTSCGPEVDPMKPPPPTELWKWSAGEAVGTLWVRWAKKHKDKQPAKSGVFWRPGDIQKVSPGDVILGWDVIVCIGDCVLGGSALYGTYIIYDKHFNRYAISKDECEFFTKWQPWPHKLNN